VPRRRGSRTGIKTSALDLGHPTPNYYLALGFFVLGLMSKPMLVTWPLVLLLLDYWPIQRINHLTIQRLLLEKLPFFALAIVLSVITFLAQRAAGTLSSTESLTIADRITNSIVSYVGYLGKMFWPDHLSIFYPRPMVRSLWEISASVLLLVSVTALAIWQTRRRPFLLFGWLWYVGTLVPVIQLVQTGSHAMADRYTYIPLIGLFIMVAWGLKDIAARWPRARPWMIGAAIAAIAVCIPVTRAQLLYWRDSESLFRHALKATRPNVITHIKLGEALVTKGKVDEGIKEYRAALQIETLINGQIIGRGTDEPDEMARINAGYALIRCKIAAALAAEGKNADAEAEYVIAMQLKPGDAEIRSALMWAVQMAATDRAAAHLSEARKIQFRPGTGYSATAAAAARRKKIREAIAEYTGVLRGNADLPIVQNNLAWLLATSEDPQIRNGAEAIQHAERACESTHYQVPFMIGTLAAAYAEAGRFDDAVATAQKACALAGKSSETNLLKRNQELLGLYRAHKAYHETR